MKLAITSLGLIFLPLAATAQQTQNPYQQGPVQPEQQTGAAQQSGATQTNPTPDESAPRKFVERAAQFHMTQAHLAQMAKDRAQPDSMKQAAETGARDHQRAYERLGQIVKQFSFTVPKAIDDEHKQIISRFENLNGKQFDDQYRTHLQQTQERAEWFRQQAQSLNNADLKQYSSDMAAQLDSQVQRAQNLDRAPQHTVDIDRTSTQGSADRQEMRGGHEVRGTVTHFEAGKTLEVKIRDRLGRHRYDLKEIRAEAPADLQAGTQVTVTERIDANGYRSIHVRPERDGQSSADRQDTPPRQQ